jgi:hypothetical protein
VLVANEQDKAVYYEEGMAAAKGEFEITDTVRAPSCRSIEPFASARSPVFTRRFFGW